MTNLLKVLYVQTPAAYVNGTAILTNFTVFSMLETGCQNTHQQRWLKV